MITPHLRIAWKGSWSLVVRPNPEPKLGDPKHRLGNAKPKLGDPKPRLGDTKPVLGDLKPRPGDPRRPQA